MIHAKKWKTCFTEFLNAIEEMNRKKLKGIEFFEFLLAVDSTKPVWKKALTKIKRNDFEWKKLEQRIEIEVNQDMINYINCA